ncbi:ABC transporter substrate-binding protein [Aeromonas cavernicola]|uniref:ABC transporter substrate-binding protein n=1 Tax=Aeromonas cavernicola TaxID=1006623 RepID=A0A2H9U0E4_9GAMM|nr:ABC transporter substrate-binding protein [Aeromonas cavernicola]PJG57449.1 ABC transporter substrate-binding protein [Aeromonas cavernicola]
MQWLAALVLTLPMTVVHVHAASTQYPVTVNNCGSPLTIEKRPERAVFHDINMSEMAFVLDLQGSMVGVTGISGWYKMSEGFKQKLGNIPELASKYPILETLLAAKPDFFFAGWGYGMTVGGDVTPQTLAPYGIDTLVLTESCVLTHKVDEPASMDLLYRDIEKLGVIFDRQDQAHALVTGWKARLAALPKPAMGANVPKVFLYDSGEDKPFTAGKYAMPDAMIRAAGAHNVTHDMTTSWATTSWENVANANPDVIILLDYQTASGANSLQHFLENHPLMQHTNAVKNRRYVKLRYEQLTPGPANVDAIEKLSQAFYPK